MNRIISLLLSSLLLINTTYAKPIKVKTEATFSLVAEEVLPEERSTGFVWEPELIPDIKLGNITLDVWYLQEEVAAPITGYLISTGDWVSVRRTIKGFDEKLSAIIQQERAACKAETDRREEACKQLNQKLIDDLDAANLLITSNNKLIGSLENQMFWWKVGVGIAGTVLLGTVIYYEVR